MYIDGKCRMHYIVKKSKNLRCPSLVCILIEKIMRIKSI